VCVEDVLLVKELTKQLPKKKKEHTKDYGIQAFIFHVFINKHQLFSFETVAQQTYQINVLKFCNQNEFIF
jgi:hypothetical protein